MRGEIPHRNQKVSPSVNCMYSVRLRRFQNFQYLHCMRILLKRLFILVAIVASVFSVTASPSANTGKATTTEVAIVQTLPSKKALPFSTGTLSPVASRPDYSHAIKATSQLLLVRLDLQQEISSRSCRHQQQLVTHLQLQSLPS